MNRFNIYLRKDGRLEGRVPLEKAPCGKRRYRAFFSHSQEELIEKITAFRKEHAGKQGKRAVSITFEETFREWFETISPRVKESTAANYWMKSRKHLLPYFGGMHICGITPGDIYAFMDQKKTAGLSDRYITDNLTLLRTVFRYAQKQYQIPDPMDEVIFHRPKRKETVLLDEPQQDLLSAYLQEHLDRTSLGIALCRTTGLRIGELCALRWEDVDLKKREMTVRHTLQRIQIRDGSGSQKTRLVLGEPKTDTSKRVIPLPETMIPRLRQFLGEGKTFLLTGTERPAEPRVMQYRFAGILKKTGLPAVHFHALRHMFATNCIRLGIDMKSLSELLGHSRIETTMNLYVHSSLEQKRAFVDRLTA